MLVIGAVDLSNVAISMSCALDVTLSSEIPRGGIQILHNRRRFEPYRGLPKWRLTTQGFLTNAKQQIRLPDVRHLNRRLDQLQG